MRTGPHCWRRGPAGPSISTAIHCLDTKTGRLDTFDGSAVDLLPRMDGRFIVFAGGSGRYYQPMCTSVFLGDLATGTTKWLRSATSTVSYGYPEISGNRVVWLRHRGGRFVNHSHVTARNCLIAGSRSSGIWGGLPSVENCTIVENRGYAITSVQADITNCIVYFNHSGGENLVFEVPANPATYSDIQGGWPGTGNFDADPLFVANGSWEPPGPSAHLLDAGSRWMRGDYHLQSAGWSWDAEQRDWTWDEATSPCIDAGDPSLPLGEEAPCAAGGPLSDRAAENTRVNVGAYGGTAEASLAPHGWSR